MSEQPHSAEYFGEARDFWWNRDFLELMSRRWKLEDVRCVLDVGCGIGHWGRCLAPFLSTDATVLGIDREPSWVAKAEAIAGERQLSRQFSYRQGSAEELPAPDCSFDMVTCQTLLIHVADPPRVLREMQRTLKPGGLLAVCEPNNVSLDLSNLDMLEPIEEIVETVKCQMICERGKMKLGEGYNSLGPQVPGIFSELGLREIQVHHSDKVAAMYPPYQTDEQRALLKQSLEWQEKDFWRWDRNDTQRYFLAGGGTPEQFETYWASGVKGCRDHAEALRGGRYHGASAVQMFLVSGRKPHAF